MALEMRRLLRFGPFRLEPDTRLVFRGGEPVSLRPRVFDTLLALAQRPSEIVTKEELLDAVWPDTVVEENNLNQNILALRRLLERHPEDGLRIETIPRRGYVLVVPAPKETVGPAPVALPPPARGSSTAAPAVRLQVAATILALLAAALAFGWIWKRAHGPAPISGVRSIAVLPFRSLGGESADDYLGLGLADAVITRLGFVRALSVRPTASIRGYLGGPRDPLAAGRRLQVDAVLDGQIQKSHDRLRVTVQLVSIRTGSAVWSEKFDVPWADLFTVEDGISEAVSKALVSSLSERETRRVGRDRPTTPGAYEAYLKGRFYWNQRRESATRKAQELFERAIALDPDYAPAYAGLADTLNALHHRDADPQRARRTAERALALDDTLAEAYASLGNTSLFTDWNFAEAEANFLRAIDLNPSYATAHQWYAYCFLVRGDLDGALREVQRAHEIDPLSPSIGVDLGLMQRYAGRGDKAVAAWRRVLEIDPAFAQAHQMLLVALLEAGDPTAARAECPELVSADPGFGDACLALVSARTGRRSEAEQHLSRIDNPERWTLEAGVALALGDRVRAIRSLEEGYRRHSAAMLLIGADPEFDPLRSDPRFAALLERIGLTPVTRPVSATASKGTTGSD
ncbi:MAG TPA: winged helix-turn-helix domain-containing protein [Thermoanaerobaculia bacterium]|nr:winged helix-turn-helix domain-containing protein [Thermoanaerobaculia bacterium]